jgi:hypothetical protein
VVDQVRPLVASGNRREALRLLIDLRAGRNDALATVLDDLIAVLSEKDSADG